MIQLLFMSSLFTTWWGWAIIVCAGAAIAAAAYFLIVFVSFYNAPPVPPPAQPMLPTAIIRVGQASFTVEIAESIPAQVKGLSGRTTLLSDSGMVFLYASKAGRKFWMPNMYFGLDIIWIADGKVAGITPDVPSEQDVPLLKKKTYPSPVPVDMVLEVAAGEAERRGISIGDTVELLRQ
jgi:hypothetical protein